MARAVPTTVTPIDEDLWFDGGGGKDAEDKAARSMAAMAARVLGAKPLPLAARRLADLTRNANARIEQTVRVLESDPALSARLLRLVNSAGYALRMRCASVHHAAALVGTRRLHHVATTAAVMDLFDAESDVAAKLLEHATIVGALCRYLAVHLGLPRDELFTCGFLHDIGQLMLLDSEGESYRGVLEAAGDSVDVAHLHERAHYGYDHAVLAAHVLGAWNIPDPIPRVVAWHHTPSRAYESGGMVGAMVAALRLADALSVALAEADVAVAVTEVARSDGAVYLDVSEAQLAAIWKELQALRGQSSARSGGAEVADAEIVPRHDIRPSMSPRAHGSLVSQAPMHFPCVVCQKPSYGNVCPCCEGYVCPTHQNGSDEWCSACTRGYLEALDESRLGPAEYAGLSLLGLGLGAGAAAGAVSTAPDATLNLVVGPVLAVSLAAIVFVVGRSSYLRARFVTRRRKQGFELASSPSSDRPEASEPVTASRDGEPKAPSAFELSLDALLDAPEATLGSPGLALPSLEVPVEFSRGALAPPLDVEIPEAAPPAESRALPLGSTTLKTAAIRLEPAPRAAESEYPRIDVRPLFSAESIPALGASAPPAGTKTLAGMPIVRLEPAELSDAAGADPAPSTEPESPLVSGEANTRAAGARHRCQTTLFHPCVVSRGAPSLRPESEPETESAPAPREPTPDPVAAFAPPPAAASVADTLLALPSIDPEPARDSLPGAPRRVGAALSISPNAFDDEPDPDRASRRGKGSRAAGGRRARYS